MNHDEKNPQIHSFRMTKSQLMTSRIISEVQHATI